MKILFFTESGLGVSALACDQLKAIHEKNEDVYAVVSSFEQEPGLINSLEEKGINVVRMDGMENHQNFWLHAKKLKEVVVNNSIEFVHVQTNWQLVMTYFAFRKIRCKPKVIYTIHSFRNHKGLLECFLAKLLITLILFLFSDLVFASCKFLKNAFSVLGSKVVILPIGIDQMYIERAFVKPIKNIVMIFPARFREGKHQDILIRALRSYINKTGDKGIKLILPGDGENLDLCITLSKELGVDRQVEFPGLCSKTSLLSYYDQSNILVCSSASETYCQSIVEGLALGKCILSTPVGVATEVLDNKQSGFIFHNEEELVKLLLDIHSGEILLNNICEYNYNKRLDFSWRNISSIYMDYLLNIKK